MSAEQLTNGPITLLSGDITSGATSLTVTSATPFPSSGQCRILLDTELMLVTAGLGTTTWTVVRGIEGTTADAHGDQSKVFGVLTSGAAWKHWGGVNAQTGTTYTVAATDKGKLLTLSNASAVAVALPTPTADSSPGTGPVVDSQFFFDAKNLGNGTATLTPATGTIDGVASVGLVTGAACRVFADGTNWFTNRGASRPLLTAALTLYVATAGSGGSDSNPGTSGSPFLTIQKAVNVALTYDSNLNNITISIAAGTYTGAIVLQSPLIGGGMLTISGAGATTIISTTGVSAITVTGAGSALVVQNCTLQTTTAGKCLFALNGGFITLGPGLVFGACAEGQIWSQGAGSRVFCNGNNYTVNNSAAWHVLASNLGQVELDNRTVTITGTPAFSGAFAGAFGGLVFEFGSTYSGSATGTRYSIGSGGSINTSGGGSTYYPGSGAGSGGTTTGGGYYV